MLNNIKMAIASVNLYTSGANMVQGLINGINSKKEALIAAVRSLAQAANLEFNKLQNMGSPSKVWAQKGKWLVEGCIIGMEKTMPDLKTTAQDAAYMAMPYTPDDSVITTHASSTEQNTYAPQFTLNFNGTADERIMARKVKTWIKEALDDTFDGIGRKQPRTQQI